MIIAIGADHGGFELKQGLAEHLRSAGHQVIDVGTSSKEAVDYPVYARAVAETVAAGKADRGIMIDGAGIGSAMVANKIPGVRAALGYDLSSARNGREHNDANVLTLGAGLIGEALARQIVDVFLTTECREERHLRRVAMIGELDGAVPLPVSAPSAASAGPELSAEDLDRILGRLTSLLGNRALVCTGESCVTTDPATARRLLALGAGSLSHGPDRPGSVPADLARYIDHTLLKPDATRDQILRICAEAREFGFRSVCVNPFWARTVTDALRGSGVLTCCVVGFPLGANVPETKALEARRAIRDGAGEIDMVINIGALKGGEDDIVLGDIRAVVEACRDGGAVCKVIIETVLLSDDEKIRACELARRARAHFVKTSTGFAGGGATAEDVALMASVVRSAGMEVKASGGIHSYTEARRMIEAGATRIGASASVAIVKDVKGATAGAS